MKTIRDYIQTHRADFIDELQEILAEIQQLPPEELNQQTLVKFATDLATEAINTYNSGFDRCLDLVEKADVGFLNQRVPRHLKP